MAIHEAAAKGFSADADAYERGRPEYSSEAVARLIHELRIGPDSRVLDLAAGTGKLTRQLVPTGAEIVAVEPVHAMRERLQASLPGIEAIDGTAERIPLPSHSVDAVVVGQAFHWFDGIRAVSEIRRVLRPEGALGLIWQSRNPARPWVERLNEIIDRVQGDEPRYRTLEWRRAFDDTALFEPLRSALLDHIQRGSVETVVDRVVSISYVASLPPVHRERVAAEVRALLGSDPETAGRDVLDLPYRAHVYWARPTAVPHGPSTGIVLAVNTSPGGVPKRPVTGTTRIRRLGVDGDAHRQPEPLHGGPLQAVCLDAFEAMERLRAEGHDTFPGAFGENLTIAGLDWNGLRSGDRLQIGGEHGPLLQLTHVARPCRSQAQWFRDGRVGRISAATYPQDARWYASVVEEGRVTAGDEVRLSRTA